MSNVGLGLRVAALISEHAEGELLARFILRRFERAHEMGYKPMTVADADEAFDLWNAAQEVKRRRQVSEDILYRRQQELAKSVLNCVDA